MPRPFNPELRTELLRKIVDYILDNGLGHGISLRPLAKAVHTSPRMLMYFFGSKEQLMAEVVRYVRLREELDFVQAVAGPGGRKQRLLRLYDSRVASPRTANFWRLCFGIYGVAVQRSTPFAEFLEGMTRDWLEALEPIFSDLPRAEARNLATVTLAAARGLQLDLLSTGDRGRVRAAFLETVKLLGLVEGGRVTHVPRSRKRIRG
jgi:AcrR family transcriptional regulator